MAVAVPVTAPILSPPSALSIPDTPLPPPATRPSSSTHPVAGPISLTPLPTPVPVEVASFDLGPAAIVSADMVAAPSAPAGLFQRQPGLKYMVAAVAIVVLIILLGLVILRSDREKPIDPIAAAEAERGKREPVKSEPPKPDPPPAQVAKADPPKAEEPKDNKPTPTERPGSPPTVEERSPTPSRRGSRHGARDRTPAHEHAPRDKAESKPPRLAGARPNPFDEGKATISQSQIMGVVRDTSNQGSLRACYERALKMDSRLTSGRIDVKVAISTSGSVQRVVINAPSSFILVEPCIKTAVKRWHFPSNAEEYETSFPLIMQGGM
jgi:outer membrane biosynthesis protein TonB